MAEIELVHATIGVDKEQPGLGYSHAVEQSPERSELPASSSSHGLNQSTADCNRTKWNFLAPVGFLRQAFNM